MSDTQTTLFGWKRASERAATWEVDVLDSYSALEPQRRNDLTAEEWENPSTEEQAKKKQSRIDNTAGREPTLVETARADQAAGGAAGDKMLYDREKGDDGRFLCSEQGASIRPADTSEKWKSHAVEELNNSEPATCSNCQEPGELSWFFHGGGTRRVVVLDHMVGGESGGVRCSKFPENPRGVFKLTKKVKTITKEVKTITKKVKTITKEGIRQAVKRKARKALAMSAMLAGASTGNEGRTPINTADKIWLGLVLFDHGSCGESTSQTTIPTPQTSLLSTLADLRSPWTVFLHSKKSHAGADVSDDSPACFSERGFLDFFNSNNLHFLDDFSVDEALLGKGGSGKVVQGLHLASGTRVAIKVIDPLQRQNAERARKLFEREVELHWLVSHLPGVVRWQTLVMRGFCLPVRPCSTLETAEHQDTEHQS
eukprot:g15977.t2